MEMQRNRVQEPDDGADLSEELEYGDDCENGGLAFRGSDFSPGGISRALDLKKMDFQGQMQQGFSLQSSKVMKAKRRKGEKIEIHDGLIVQPTGRRDRHSKVCTARGTTRDRRLRLSPRTAIQFYDVQDRLGCDRPSKAIDWLMKEAKSAIEALDGEAKMQQIEMERGPVPESELVKIVRHEPLDQEKLISRLSFPGYQAYSGYDFNAVDSIPASTYSSQIWDTNFDLEKFQKSVTWNCHNSAHSSNPREETDCSVMRSPPLHSAPPVLSQSRMFFQREPLQSSVVDYPKSRPELPGMSYDVGKGTLSGYEFSSQQPFYPASFLHHQD